MPDDRFEDRLRALAQQLSQSLNEVDLDEVADRLGVDADRIRGAADAAQGFLGDRRATGEPLFGGGSAPDPRAYEPVPRAATPVGGPHPLDLPGDAQGRALSALDSGRWTLRPGSGRLSRGDGDAVGPEPPADADLTGDLRARDWITTDGTLTLVGRQALLRWCATASGPADPPADAPGAEPAS